MNSTQLPGKAMTALALFALSACGWGSSPAAAPSASLQSPAAEPPPTARPGQAWTTTIPHRLDEMDATALSQAVVHTIWAVDAARDTGQRQAFLRARPYLTQDCAARLQAEPVGTIPNLWREHRAYAQVRLTPQSPESGAGPESQVLAHRQFQVTVTPTGRDGWKGTPIRAITFTTLIRPAANTPWRISDITTA